MNVDLPAAIVLVFAVFWAVLIVLALVSMVLLRLARWVRSLADSRFQREKARADTAEHLLAGARQRERLALNLLADMQALRRPFPDANKAAGSLGDEVEAWLATNPTEQ